MIRIAIVEDEKSAADELSEMLSRYAAANLGGGGGRIFSILFGSITR